MAADLADAARVYVRYDLKFGDAEETRRQLNERMIEEGAELKQETPPLTIPEGGEYIWDWYLALSARLKRIHDGVCIPIPPSEFVAWRDATGQIIRPSEYDCLCAMDSAYCDEMGKELAALRAAQRDKPPPNPGDN